MSNVEIPDSLSIAGWEKQKSAMAKDKAVASKLQGETSKVAESVKALDKAQSSVDFSMFDPKGINSAAAAQAAIDKIEAAVKGDLKTLLTAAKSAGTAADTFVSACDKLRKTLKGDSEKIATAAWTATKAASSAATKFAADVGAAVTSAQAELEALCSKLKAGDKKTAAPNPKAAADGKAIGALIKKSIAACAARRARRCRSSSPWSGWKRSFGSTSARSPKARWPNSRPSSSPKPRSS